MIELFCVVDEPAAAVAAGCGREDGDLCLIRTSRISCVGRPCRTPEVRTDGEALVEHDATVRRMMAVSTVVPFRYGTVLPGAAEAERELRRREETFERLLRHLKGQVEMALRARTSDVGAGNRHRSGRDYLQSLRSGSGDPLLDHLHRALAAEATAAVADGGRAGTLKASYLVPADGVDRFRQTLLRAVERGDEKLGSVSLTGPWPPYSFVDGGTPVSEPIAEVGRGG